MEKKSLGTVELLATAVREGRDALGSSVEALALVAGVEPGFVADLEVGLGAHDLRKVLRVLKALGISASALPSVANPNAPRLSDIILADHLDAYARFGVAGPPPISWPPFPAKRPGPKPPTRRACWCTEPSCTRHHHQ